MDAKKNLLKTECFVKQVLRGEGTGHDWWHIDRVRKMALYIAKKEGGDGIVVELASLLHDIADRKLNNGGTQKGIVKIRNFLLSISTEQKMIEEIIEIVITSSYSNSFMKDGTRRIMKTREGQIVQDADRLDAIGAIGIARAFAYGGHKGRVLYDPAIKPCNPTSTKQYIKAKSHTINHFYEKLLLLKDLMNTKTAKKLAKKRHIYMRQFLNEFTDEWEGKSLI